MTDDIVKNRDTLTHWIYNLHNKVNQKLGITYDITYDDFVEKYETFRAKCKHDNNGCVMPIELKADAYKRNLYKEAPVIKKN